ncbi:hypothetical protein AB0F49_12280 [Micromonospora ureilytica]|uniref:FUSC family protein n=1 Tax=Micromonospora ureilytica TaxID=709868 RepID=UPI0033DB4080
MAVGRAEAAYPVGAGNVRDRPDVPRLCRDATALALTDQVRVFALGCRVATGARLDGGDASSGLFEYARHSPWTLYWWQFRSHLAPRSAHLHSSLRLAVALAIARVAAGVLQLTHGFGVLLAFGVGRLLGPVWQQALFTVLLTVVFAQLSPEGWRLAEARLVDVLLGAVIGVLAGVAMWPRGAGHDLRHNGTRYLAASADAVEQTVQALLGAAPPPDRALSRLRRRMVAPRRGRQSVGPAPGGGRQVARRPRRQPRPDPPAHCWWADHRRTVSCPYSLGNRTRPGRVLVSVMTVSHCDASQSSRSSGTDALLTRLGAPGARHRSPIGRARSWPRRLASRAWRSSRRRSCGSRSRAG